MKLKEKLALEYLNDKHPISYSTTPVFEILQAHRAGFEKAREMAIALYYEDRPDNEKSVDFENLGEEEVE